MDGFFFPAGPTAAPRPGIPPSGNRGQDVRGGPVTLSESSARSATHDYVPVPLGLGSYVLKENDRMLQLGAALGMQPAPAHEDPDTVKLTRGLQGPATTAA